MRGLLFLIFVMAGFTIKAQKEYPGNFGRITATDFEVQSKLADTGVKAIVMYDYGEVNFVGNNKGWFTMLYQHRRRVLIKKSAGYSFATVMVPLYRDKESKETIDNIVAASYTMEGGVIVRKELDLKELYEEKYDRHYYIKKFTIPGVKEGSIIEYAYRVKSDFFFNLPEWHFQHEGAPVLWSEFKASIPGLFTYLSSEKSQYPYHLDSAVEGYKHYSIRRQRKSNDGDGFASTGEKLYTVSSTTVERHWVKKDVPAFVAENHITSPKNFMDGISFQLIKTYDGESYYDEAATWSKVADDLMKRDDFGFMLTRRNDWLYKELQAVYEKEDDKLTAAKKIYTYVQQHYTCNNSNSFFLKGTLQDVVKNKSGTAGEINLLLAVMLQTLDIPVQPVLLSTRDFGRNSATYPVLHKLNYVLCRAIINQDTYILDAAVPFLPFGKLHYKCHNGHARIIDKNVAALYLSPDDLAELHTVSVEVKNSDNGAAEGSFTETKGLYASLNFKNNIRQSGEDYYKQKLIEDNLPDIEVNNIQIEGADAIDKPVQTSFNFSLPAFDGSNVIYFNPVLWNTARANPFPAMDRKYPVELPYKSVQQYTLKMDIPPGYRIDEMPKSAITKLNNDEGVFEYIIKEEEGQLFLKTKVQINNTFFNKDQYGALRDFYAAILQHFGGTVVFKKIK
ncbi:MAG TPA: transglutaminase-like domain-containing protein [Ferruginibacter sp.]|nr:transglutaminase-like domain-containing protein [Ferruginibacter sp.]HMP20888.1 transglutaminase-like domain-containing protein [Ferruginibacter sp.]